MTAALLPDRDRHVIPRWRAPGRTLRAGEFRTAPSADRASNFDREAVRALGRFEARCASGVDATFEALEVAAGAVLAQREDLRTLALEYLGSRGMNPLEELPSREIPPTEFDFRNYGPALISKNRERLRRDVRDTLAWSEMARGYTLVGLIADAERAMKAAAVTAPESVYVTRAYARLLVHMKEFDHAHAIVASHPMLDVNPWLQAAEIGTAHVAEMTSLSARRAKVGLYGGDWEPYEASELAAAVATAEFHAGRDREARRFGELALLGSHDNSLAQLVDLEKRGLRMPEEQIRRTLESSQLGFEARALRAYEEADWEMAWADGALWQTDQAFATNPARLLSFVAIAALADPDLALQAACTGLRANPNHPTLLNNAAFCEIVLGKLGSAVKHLSTAKTLELETQDRVPLAATAGLLAYRLDDVRTGEEAYDKARELALSIEDVRLATAVDVFHAWARAQLGLQHESVEPTRISDPALRAMSQRVEDGSLPLRPIREHTKHTWAARVNAAGPSRD